MKINVLISLIFSGLVYLNATSQTTILPNDPNIQYVGRFDMKNPKIPAFSWTGTQIITNFQGTSLKMTIDTWQSTFFNIYIDGVLSILEISGSGSKTYSLASGLADTTHSVAIFKRDSPWLSHNFKGLILDSGKGLIPPPARQIRKIEFYGDSQLQGCQNEVPGTGPDLGDYIYDNNYYSYGAITARALNAEYSCIAEAGVSLTPYSTRPDLPGFYDRTGCGTNYSKWDFRNWQADVVCINLGVNDNPFPTDFASRYVTFVQKLRNNYPLAHIFLLAGPMNMETAKTDAISASVSTLNTLGDKKVYYYKFKTVNTIAGHPRKDTHIKCADELVEKINSVIWGLPDSLAPGAPTQLRVNDSTNTSLTLSWQASTDNIGVVGYEIYKNGQLAGTTSADTFKLTGLYCGISCSISVKARDNYGNWSNASVTLHASTKSCITTGSEENVKNQEILIYPNPGSKIITVSNLPANEGITVFTLEGKIVSHHKPVSSSVVFDVTGWTKGTYILNVQLKNDTIVKRVVVE